MLHKSEQWAPSSEKEAQRIKRDFEGQSDPSLCLTAAFNLLKPFLTEACVLTL